MTPARGGSGLTRGSCRVAAFAFVFVLTPRPTYAVALDDALPSWLSIRLTQRSRFEYLDEQFRQARGGPEQGLALRTHMRAAVSIGPARFTVELLDARMYFVNDKAALNSGLINPVEVLQANVALGGDAPFGRGQLGLRLGRMTIDVGSRRFVARNNYRNTINAFTGLDMRWRGDRGRRVRLFATLPVLRRPTDRDSLADHRIEFDREGFETVFGGALFGSGPRRFDTELELYTFGLYERDSRSVATADRRLVTLGVRAWRSPRPGALDFEVEMAFQSGVSRASRAAAEDLDHVAGFGHVSIGYTFDVWARPRVVFQHDSASGDGDSDDGQNNRFDTLYGARRFEYGPTGLYGAFARTNLHSPGVRIVVKPWAVVDGFVAYRAVWLASAADAWTTAGIRSDGEDFVGHQLEGRLRWHVAAPNVTVEAGVAHSWLSSWAGRDPTYGYVQLTLGL